MLSRTRNADVLEDDRLRVRPTGVLGSAGDRGRPQAGAILHAAPGPADRGGPAPDIADASRYAASHVLGEIRREDSGEDPDVFSRRMDPAGMVRQRVATMDA